MKNKLSLLFFCMLLNIGAGFSQVCVPDGQYTDPGVYPDSIAGLPDATIGSAYSTVMTLVVADSTPESVIINFNRIDSIGGLPAGLSYQCVPSNCQVPGGSSGCILFSGQAQDAGSYDLTLYITANVTFDFLGTFDVPGTYPSHITVGEGALLPVAAFDVPVAAVTGQVIPFHNNSLYATSYLWSYPGGAQSITTAETGSMIYYNPGIYHVTLIAYNANGSDTLTQNITVTGAPVVQFDCSDGRYTNPDYFSSWDTTGNIVFGSALAPGTGQPQDLKMTVFEPTGDTIVKRPLIIFAFGGSFMLGDRTDVYPLCEDYVKLGYVVAAIDYRVEFFFIPQQISTTKAIFRGVHDLKAAVRYFYKDAQTVNQFKIDTNYIITGGLDAGAVVAVNAAYLDDNSEIPSYFYNDTTGMGGVEGYSGNPGYSSDVYAVIDYSGSIINTAWMDEGDAFIVGAHDTYDTIIPYATGIYTLAGIESGLTTHGLYDIKQRALELGLPSGDITFVGDYHCGYLGAPEYDTTFSFTRTFLSDLLCGNAISCIASANFTLYPDVALEHNWFLVPDVTGVSPIEYAWDWGDGATSTGSNPSHVYSAPGNYNICLTITDNTGCADNFCSASTYVYKTDADIISISVVNEVPTGIEQLPEKFAKFYPNPAENTLTIETLSQSGFYNLQDVTGKLLLSGDITSAKVDLDISAFNSGVYFISVTDGDKQMRGKIIKR